MAAAKVPDRDYEEPAESRFRILSIDGGGLRGLIPALVLVELERQLQQAQPGATLAPAST